MKLTKTQILKKIEKYFNSINQKIFLKKDLSYVLASKNHLWKLRETINTEEFISMIKESRLKEIKLASPHYKKTYTRFSWGDEVSIYQLGLSLKPRSYLSHYTAMYFHGIADTISKTIYVNSEQSPKPYGDVSLEQSRIDIAFNGKPRTSKYIFNYEGWSICILNGKNTNNLGVEKIKSSENGMLFVTNIERTLIDIAVRPIYSGGVEEVQMAYQKAKGKISIKKLVTMLKKIDYVYPYHQVIGFYMQRAGFDEDSLNLLKKIGIEYDFYLDYKMKKKKYSKEWRLYYPNNF
jgi:predicted transcriptional regulator of viral defense system